MTETEGQHRLWGPGLDPGVGQGRVSYMGGKWPARLASMCLQITGEFEDDEKALYHAWLFTNVETFGDFLCRNVGRFV